MMMRIMMKEVRDMFGPYDDLFDFDHDGKMDGLEVAAEMDYMKRLQSDSDESKDSLWLEEEDDSFTDEMDELEEAGLDTMELEMMEEEERREAIEDAGLDPDDYDF